MSSVDGFLRLLHSKLAAEIAQNFEVTNDAQQKPATKPDTVLQGPEIQSAAAQPLSHSLAGLTAPSGAFSTMDQDAALALLQNAIVMSSGGPGGRFENFQSASHPSGSGGLSAEQQAQSSGVLRQTESQPPSAAGSNYPGEFGQDPAPSPPLGAKQDNFVMVPGEYPVADHRVAFADLQKNAPADGLSTLLSPEIQTQRTGIIASAILNAAIIPGWPPPHPIESEAIQLTPAIKMSDEEMLTYLANLGASPALIEKARKMLEQRRNGKKILFYLAILMTALSVVIDRLVSERSALMDEESEVRENLEIGDLLGNTGKRHRLYLE